VTIRVLNGAETSQTFKISCTLAVCPDAELP